jgi:hypothetical protein
VAHDGKIESVQQLLEQLNKSPITKQKDSHTRVWFRGQADQAWRLEPGVYRSDFPGKTEGEWLTLERHLAQDFRVMSAGIRRGDEGEAELYFLQQHYRMWTRLLDWTNNALAGLYFAVSSRPASDGMLFMMDAYRLGPTQNGKYNNGMANFEGIADSRHPLFQEALHVIYWWDNDKQLPDFIFPIRPDYFDRRITLQRGCFTFHVPRRRVLTGSENDTLKSYLIPAPAKRRIADELALLGIDDFSIFGDMEHLSSRLKAAYGTPS